MSGLMKYALPKLTREEEVALIKTAKSGCAKSREKFIRHNIPLVVNIAGRYRIPGYDNEDMTSIAMTSLLRAIDAFDISRGNKFSTIAVMYMWRDICKERSKYRNGGGVKYSEDNLRCKEPFPGLESKVLSLDGFSKMTGDGSASIHEVTPDPYFSNEFEQIDGDLYVDTALTNLCPEDAMLAKLIINDVKSSEWQEMTGESVRMTTQRRRRIKKQLIKSGAYNG